MTLPGLDHTITIQRYADSVNAEGIPNGAPVDVVTTKGYVHEYSSRVALERSGTVGAEYTGRALLPYGIDVREQDLLAVTFADGTQDAFRVEAVRDNHIMLRCDLSRSVD